MLVTVDGVNTPLTVRGNARFDGTLQVARTPLLTSDGSYRLIQVDGSRGTTTFSSELLPVAAGLFTFSTSYDADGVLLNVMRAAGLAAVAQGSNRTAIARHLDDTFLDPTTPALLQGEIGDLIDGSDDLNAVFDALNPEAYDAQTTMIADSSRRIANLLVNRPRECQLGQLDPWQASTRSLPCHARTWSPWVAVLGSVRKRDAFAGHPEYESQIGGIIAGIDTRPLRDLELTFAVSSQRGQIDVRAYGESDLVLADLSGHALWNVGPVRLQGVATWGYGSHNSRRMIRFDNGTTPYSANAEDDFASQHAAVSAQAGWLIEAGSIDIEPLVGVDYTWISQDEIREQNAGIFGARIKERDDDILSAVGGLRLSTAYHHTQYLHNSLLWMDGVWRPVLDLRWRQTISGYDRDVKARLASAPDTVSSFTIEGKEDKGGFEIAAGLSFVPEKADRLQFDVRYDAYRSSHTLEHDIVARVRLGF